MRLFTVFALAAAFLGAGASPLLADVLHLKNGGKVEGAVEEVGDTYRVKHRCGIITVRKSDVVAIEKKPTLEQRFAERRGEIDLENPDERVALGHWCRENGWESQAVKEYRAAIALDPAHRGAHRALDHIYYEGEWRTEREIMERKGFVKYRGEWMTPEEASAKKAAKERAAKTFGLQKALNRHFRRLAGSSQRGRDKAYRELVTLAGKLGNDELAEFAGQAKAYYDEAWRIVHSQTGVFEIRAQMSRLKRPIPTITTTLGALSTPVTIQLPEMQVASVGTTVVIPIGGR